MTMSCVADAVATSSAPKATSRQRAGRIAEAEEHDRRDQQQLREHQPAAPAAEQRDRIGTSSASTSGAHRNLRV